jgi:nucleotide-binding universal stress UspA family protein
LIVSWLTDRKIVVPFDYSNESQGAVDVALELAPSMDNITVVHVSVKWHMISPTAPSTEISEDARRDHLANSFREQLPGPKYAGLKFEVLFGDPGHEIANYAKDIGAGLIVMPSTGRTGFEHLLIGSVAERVVRFAHCPVLVLRW